MRIPSGVTTQYAYFVAVDPTDLKTKETGLTGFSVYRSRNAGTATAMTTPTVTELSAANMPGVYALLVDEDTTIDSGYDTQEMALYISHASMAPVTRTIELYRPKVTIGNTLDVNATGEAGIDLDNTSGTLAKGTDITGFNDIAATDIVSGGAITTSSGVASANVVQISSDSTAADTLKLQYNGTGITGSTYPSTQAQLTNIVAVGAATNVPAESYILTTGTQSANTYSATAALDTIRHEHTDTAGAMDLYYQFDIGGDGAPVSVTMVGYLVSANDSLAVQAYNWSGATWDQVGILQGGPAADSTATYALYAGAHVGITGADLGKVRVRFYAASGLTTATLAVDQLYVSYAIVNKTVGYANGSFWINTVGGTAGTVPFYNAIADRPSDSLTDCQTLSATIPLTTYTVSNNSSITLASAFDNSTMTGTGYSLALGGQSISASKIIGAVVSGIATAAVEPTFEECVIGTCTLPVCSISDCAIEGNITIGQSGEYHFHNTHGSNLSGIVLDLGAAVGDNNIAIHNWSGIIDFQNVGQLGTDFIGIGGEGIITINANCVGGSIHIQGDFEVTDNSGGAVTITYGDISASVKATETAVTITIPNLIGAPTGADIATDIANVQTKANAIEVDTQDLQAQIGAAGAGLTDLGGMSTTMKAQVANEVETNTSVANLPTAAEFAHLIKYSNQVKELTFSSGTTTTAIVATMNGVAADFVTDALNGRGLLVMDDSGATVKYQFARISASNGSTKEITFSSLAGSITATDTAFLI